MSLKDKMFSLCEALEDKGLKGANFSLSPDARMANIVVPTEQGMMQFLVHPLGETEDYSFIRVFTL